jgi:5-methylcytosine-specific restriction protein A
VSDPRSPQAAQYRLWYRSRQWRALRAAQLRREPHCRFCRAMGRATFATIVDHASPHRGDIRLFFDPENLVSLCKPHHDATKQRHEHGRRTTIINADGWPS